jgi:hypothetical protein
MGPKDGKEKRKKKKEKKLIDRTNIRLCTAKEARQARQASTCEIVAGAV